MRDMRPFNTTLFVPERGLFGPHPIAGCFIRIPLAPFEFDGERVETAVRLDLVRLANTDFHKLEGQTFTFPVNPEAGYIDGSIYLNGAHHPVDVSEIAFGRAKDGLIDATFTSVIEFAFEGLHDFGKTPWTFTAPLAWTSDVQPS